MNNLNTTVGTIYFYIKSNVVFNISGYDNEDECARKGVSALTTPSEEALIPSFTVTSSGTTTRYFLTFFIFDGDTYKANKFYHHCEGDGDGILITEYYYNECLKQIKNTIKNNPKEKYEFFNKNKRMFDIPLFMFTDSECTVDGVSQFDFSEANFNTWKNEVVQEEAYKSANARAKDFNYKVTSPESGLTVTSL